MRRTVIVWTAIVAAALILAEGVNYGIREEHRRKKTVQSAATRAVLHHTSYPREKPYFTVDIRKIGREPGTRAVNYAFCGALPCATLQDEHPFSGTVQVRKQEGEWVAVQADCEVAACTFRSAAEREAEP